MSVKTHVERLVSPTGKPMQLTPTRANEGVRAAYRKRLERLIDEMHASVKQQLIAEYRRRAPDMAQDDSPDDSPAQALERKLRRLARQWRSRFDEAGMSIAGRFVKQSMSTADVSLAEALRRAGFVVKFSVTREARDVLDASVQENVALIRSIADQHLGEVEKLVMRSVTRGRDLEQLAKDLQERYQVTKRRAAFIARDQNNKATASITRVRQRSLGITEAIWQHSSAGKQPRKSHQAAHGKRYDVDKGMYIDGEWIRPGELPNCRCVSISIIPALDTG